MRDLVIAERVIAERRRDAVEKLDEKLEKFEKNEEFSDLRRERNRLNFELSRKRVFGENGEREERELGEISKKIAKIVGNESIEEPDWRCKKCKDEGYVDGKRCECLEKVRIEVNEERNPGIAALPKRLRDVDYGVYGEEADREKRAMFLNKCLKDGKNYIVLSGGPGVGKTYLAEVALNQTLYSGAYVMEVNGVRLNRIFLNYHCAPIDKKGEIWDEIASPDVLLIDDLGVEGILNNVTLQYLYELLTERSELLTIITTNLDEKSFMNKYDQRIFSRLTDKRKGAWILLRGADLRA